MIQRENKCKRVPSRLRIRAAIMADREKENYQISTYFCDLAHYVDK